MNQPTRSRLSTFFSRFLKAAACAALALTFSNCSSTPSRNELRISVNDQKAALYKEGQLVRVYGVSTSKFGTGDQRSTYRTPVGSMKIAKKIGDGLPPGMVFKSRKATGEILPANAPGRDPIVTRIMWLSGSEAKTRNAYGRFIYIHGTPEERNIGKAASYGCIRMRSMDIIDLYNRVPVGTSVKVVKGGLPGEASRMPEYVYVPPVRPQTAPGTGSGLMMASTAKQTKIPGAKTATAAVSAATKTALAKRS